MKLRAGGLPRASRLRRMGIWAAVALGVVGWAVGLVVAVVLLGASDGANGAAAPAGSCEAVGLISVGDTGLCTHGPDPALSGDDPAVADAAVVGAAEDTSSTVCTSNGTDGRRVQVLYARRADTPDRLSEFQPSFRRWSAQASQIYTDSAAQTGGGRYVRFVHSAVPACVIDVDSITLTAAAAADFNTMVRELTAKGYGSPSRKYLVFLDVTREDVCGLGTVYPDDSAGAENANNAAKGYAVVFNGCWSSTGTIAHELGHNLGAVQASAPNATSWSHCTDEYDLMCYLDGSGEPTVVRCADATYQTLLDCNHDDYFHTNPPVGNYLRTHWNVARSGWLGTVGAPPPTTVPANDLISRATVLGALPALSETNTLWATTSSTDPAAPGEACWGNVWKTVWYRFDVPATGDYVVDTVGSSYDTVLAAFLGTPGVSTRLACNDDLDDVVLDSRVSLPDLAAGTTVYLMVGAYANSPDGDPNSPGGYLRLTVSRLPKLTLATNYGGYGAEVAVALSSFPPGTDVALTFGGVALLTGGEPATLRTDGDGAVVGSFRVPSGRRGVHTVRAQAPGNVFATARFRVTPRLRVSPSGAGAGTSVRVSLTGFVPGEPVKVQWRHPDGAWATMPVTLPDGTTISVSRVGSRGSGSFAVAVPDEAVAGLTTLRAIATTTDSRAEVSFTVAGCTLSPTNGYAGSVVAVSCAGFQPGETVDLFWGRTGTTPSASFVAVPGGTGAASFKLPAAIGGTHDVIARGRTSGRTATIPTTVKPYLRLTPASGPAGTSIDARLYGFRPGESVCVTWQVTPDDTTTLTCALVADTSGSTAGFRIAVPLDASTGGYRIVGRSSLGSVAERTFTVTSGGTGILEPSATVTPTPSTSATPVSTPTPFPTATPPDAPTATPSPLATPVPTATLTATPVPTRTPGPTETPASTDTPIPTGTPTAVPIDTPIPTSTPTENVAARDRRQGY